MARTLVADTYYLKSEWVEVLDLSSKEKLYWLELGYMSSGLKY